MTEPPPEGRAAHRSRWQRILDVIEPPDNPSAQIYGTITAGALLAAESGRRETVRQVASSVALALLVVWLAHAYAASVERRVDAGGGSLAPHLWRSLVHELALIRGAFVPLGVLLVAWAAHASVATAVTDALISAAALLVIFEVLVGVRARLRPLQMGVQVLVSAAIGLGILALRVIVH